MIYSRAISYVSQILSSAPLLKFGLNGLQRNLLLVNLRGTVGSSLVLVVVALASVTLTFEATLTPVQADTISDVSSELNAKTPSPATAADHVVVFLGGQVDIANVGYLGATTSLPGSVIGRGFAIRADGFFGNYSYRSGTLGSIGANFNGGEFDGVYQISGRSYWDNVAIGVRDVDTKLAPFDITNRRHGQISEFAASLDGGGVAGPFRTDYYAAYGIRLDDYAARVSLTHTVSRAMRLGAEASFEGDPTYSLRRVGPYSGIRIGGRSELQVSAGFSQQSGEPTSGYCRAGIYRSF